MEGYWGSKLDEEQIAATEFILDLDGTAALFAEQGTGKTIISLAILEVIKPKIFAIITPLTSVEATWTKRLRETPAFKGWRIVHTIEDFRAARKAGVSRIILVCHYEYLSRRIPQFLRIDWDMTIFDESQALKSRASGWSRAAKRIRRKSKRRLILSGTPIDKSPIDVWAQMRFIDPEIFGDRWGDFVDEWCRKGGFMNKKVIFLDKKLPQFIERLKTRAWRLSKGYLGLPPLNIIPVPIEMFGEQRRIYDDFERNDTVEVDGEEITAELVISKNIAKEQITGGFIKTKDGETIHVGSAKQRKLSWLLKRLDLPIVVFCKFLGEMDGIEERLLREVKVVKRLHGGVKDNRKTGDLRRTGLINKFQAGRIDGLIVQRKTGGVSIELTKCHDVVLYSCGFSFIDFEQIISRFHRRGQDKQVNVYVLYIIDSIDEEILEVIDEKRRTADEVVNALERKLKPRRTEHGKGSSEKEDREEDREERKGFARRQGRGVWRRQARRLHGDRALDLSRQVAQRRREA